MKDESFNQNCSAGFIEIYSLQMRTAQGRKGYALFTIGDQKDKAQFAPYAHRLRKMGFELYATKNTHSFLKKQKVNSTLIFKMHEESQPNLTDMLKQNRFDVIFHVPYSGQSAEDVDDSKMIQEWAVKNDTPYLTRADQAENFVKKLEKKMIRGVEEADSSQK
jgi:carbamoyl-phosphate synthase large subunit